MSRKYLRLTSYPTAHPRILVLEEDVVPWFGQLVLRRHLDQQHFSILDDFVGEVLPDVNVLGSLTAADDVVTPLNTRRVVLVDRGRLPARTRVGAEGL